MKKKDSLPLNASNSDFSDKRVQFHDAGINVFFNMIPDMLCIVSKDGYFLHLNSSWESTLGYTKEELMSKPFIHFIHPDDILSTTLEFSEDIAGKDLINFINRYRCKDGSYRWLEWRGKTSADGAVVNAVARDITANKLLEDQFRDQENIYHTITSAANDGIVMLDNSGNITFWNNAASTILGYSLQEVMDKNLHEIIVPESYLVKHSEAFPVFQSTGEGNALGKTLVLSAIHKNGNEIPIELSLSALILKGKWCSVGIIRDITERKSALNKLKDSEERYHSLFNNVPIGIYRTTPDGRILMANPSALRILGFNTFEELAQRNLEEDEFEPSYSRTQFRQRLENDGLVVGLQSTWIRHDGSEVFIRESAKVVRDSSGNVLFYEGTIEDLTDHKLAEALIG